MPAEHLDGVKNYEKQPEVEEVNRCENIGEYRLHNGCNIVEKNSKPKVDNYLNCYSHRQISNEKEN
jgi:hypothetical protein